MLTQLKIQNFIILESLELNFKTGLSVITGETGAGKSIIIDALSLILGGRADSAYVGSFQDKCHLTACFDIQEIPVAKQWLKNHDYGEEPWNECIIHRALLKDGKSRQMINGYSCTVQQLKDFLPSLINIHSQNQQQLLIKRSHQRELLDSFCNQPILLDTVKHHYLEWSANQKKIEHLEKLQQNAQVAQELLEYQIEEFEKAALLPGEYEQIDKEHRQLANAGQLIINCQAVLAQLSEAEKHNAQNLLYQAQNYLASIQHYDEKLRTTHELINHSIIHLEEAISELHTFTEQVEVNPERLSFIERRLSKLHELARKYQVTPALLHDIHTQLKQQLAQLKEANSQHLLLSEKAQTLRQNYSRTAQELHESRQQAAVSLNERITHEMHQLGMPGGIFKVIINANDEANTYGSDEIEFMVSTNPGQPLQSLTKVASGGEISRIALAIYVATAQKKTTPLLVFDEVDVGVGGGTAAIVGCLLKSLSQSAQVLCITHLPQVAAYGDHHFCVQKEIGVSQTATRIVALNEDERITEIARMLGGITITEKTLAHAKELILNDI